MAAMMRAQVGLIFQDEDMFNNFIEPYKQSRELNGLIMKCLTAYYYNEDARNIIEGVNPDDVGIDNSGVQTQQDICNAVRQSLMMQDYLVSELKDTIEGGKEDIDSILNKTNDLAKNTGVAKPSSSEFGEGLLKLDTSSGGTVATEEPLDEKAFMHLMFMAMMKMAQDLGNTEVVNILKGGVNSEMQSPSSEVTSADLKQVENNSVTVETEHTSDIVSDAPVNINMTHEPDIREEVKPQPVVHESVVSDKVDIAPKTNDINVTINEDADASSAIGDLMGSLF